MRILLNLEIRRGAGAVAAVAEVLNEHGFFLDQHKLTPKDEQTAEVLLYVGGDGDIENLESDVAAEQAVVAVKEFSELAESDDEPSSGDATEALQDPWVERAVRDWPAVMPILKEFSAPIGESDLEHKLTRFGVDTGAALYRRFVGQPAPSSVETGLKEVVEPALSGLAKSKTRGNTLRIVETDLATSEQVDLLFLPVESESYCCFISGVIAGILNAIPDMSKVRVKETRCLAHGDHVCDFKVIQDR